MATRTVNLRMILGKSDESLVLRQDLWTTHETVNRAVAEIEQALLLCRGEGYWVRDEKGEESRVLRDDVRNPQSAIRIGLCLGSTIEVC